MITIIFPSDFLGSSEAHQQRLLMRKGAWVPAWSPGAGLEEH